MTQTKYIANLFLSILFVILISFFYFGVTHRIAVSFDYNVPIAKSYLSGAIITMHTNNPYMYFPGSSHVFLIPFILVGFPNLFGLFSWILLFVVCKKLADTFEVSQYMAIIFAASFCMTISVVRTISDQSIDKWLCFWFLLSLLLLEKGQKTWKSNLILSLSLGMLVGTKYSGPLFFISLFMIYGKRLLLMLSPARFLVSLLLFTISGLYWYIRNFILAGSPYYPANLPFFNTHQYFAQQDWQLWKVILFSPTRIQDLTNAFLSEFLIWAFAGIFVIWFLYSQFRKKKLIDRRIIRLSLLSLTTGIASLFLPITTPYKIPLYHTISDMRYIYILVVILLLVIFLVADKFKKNKLLATIALLNSLPAFSFIVYQPKVYIISVFLIIFFLTNKTSLVEKL